MKAKIGYGSKKNLLPNISNGIFDEGDIIFTSDTQEVAFIKPDKTPMYISSRENTTFNSISDAEEYLKTNSAYVGQIISVLVNNKYVLYIVQSSSDSNLVLEQYDTKEIIWGTRPSESPQLNTIYVDNSIGYIWDGTKWIEIFKDISSKADLESPNFTGTPTIDTKPIATQEWVTENLQNTLDVKIGNLGEYETVKDYIDSKYSESEVSINDLQAAVTECKEYTNNLLQIVEF